MQKAAGITNASLVQEQIWITHKTEITLIAVLSLSAIYLQLSFISQELKTVRASVASSALVGWSWRFDGDGLKLLSFGLALAAIIMIFVIELHW